VKKLNLVESSKIVGGDFESRLNKQLHKCGRGSARACRRADRMIERHYN
jgi:hypothetical protein